MENIECLYHGIENRVQEHINNEIIQNPFFVDISSGKMSLDAVQWAMGQYYHFRNNFQRWFGIAIYNASEDESEWGPHVKNLASELAIASEEDKEKLTGEQFGHKTHKLYCQDFLRAIGVDPFNVQEPTEATLHQINWFPQRYISGGKPLEVLSALGPGNELHTGQRYEIIYRALNTHYGIPKEDMTFLAMHFEGVEDMHYEWIKDAILRYLPNGADIVEREAKNSISETAKFWRALHQQDGRKKD